MEGSSVNDTSENGGAHQSQTATTVMNPFDAVMAVIDANENADMASVSSRSTAGMQSMQSSEQHHHKSQGTASQTSSPKFGSAQLPQNPQQQQHRCVQQHRQQPQHQLHPSPSLSQPQPPTGLNEGDSAGLVPPNLYVNVHQNTPSSPLQSAGNTPTQVPPPLISTASSGTTEAGASLTSPVSGPDGADGILLGVQALEQQQANWEASQAAKRSSGRPTQEGGSSHNLLIRSKFAPPTNVLIESSDFIVQTNNPANDEFELRPTPRGDAASHHLKPLVVYGYLQKQTRSGVWQKRFFETDGENLMYYKSSKRSKLLASLDLAKVGVIQEDIGDISGRTFTIQVAGRPYFLRAEDRSTCKDWVINLNRVREARIQLGRMKLVEVPSEDNRGPELNSFRKESGDEYVSRVVVKANRSRTHGMRDESELLEIYGDPAHQESRPPQNSTQSQTQMVRARSQPNFLDVPLGEVLARWDKKRNRIAVMRTKLIRWARQVKIVKCVGDERDVITQHNNDRLPIPQGVDGERQVGYYQNDGTDTVGDSEAGGASQMDQQSVTKSCSDDMKSLGHSAWIAKETHINSHRDASLSRQTSDTLDGPQRIAPAEVYDQADDEARSLS